jgi:hypothetical protein
VVVWEAVDDCMPTRESGCAYLLCLESAPPAAMGSRCVRPPVYVAWTLRYNVVIVVSINHVCRVGTL